MSLITTTLAALAAWIVAVISATGYVGIALLMAIESACLPLPSEVIMPFGGYLVSTGQLNLFWVATAGAIGCNLGSIVAYELGKRGGRAAVAKYGRYVLVDVADLDRAERFFHRYGGLRCWSAASCRWFAASSRSPPVSRACRCSGSTSIRSLVPGPGASGSPGLV